MIPTPTVSDPAVFPEDVRRFAAERGVIEFLVPLYELAKQCFPGAAVSIRVVWDGDIADLGWIVYEVTTGHMADEARQAARSLWRDEKLKSLPPAASGSFALRAR